MIEAGGDSVVLNCTGSLPELVLVVHKMGCPVWIREKNWGVIPS